MSVGATTVAMVADMSCTPADQRILILSENVDPANRVRAVEDLHIGDLILTADGRQVAVIWIGRICARACPHSGQTPPEDGVHRARLLARRGRKS